MENRSGNGLIFQVDHLSSVTCDVDAVTPETLLTDFIRKSSTGVNIGKSIICDILVERRHILVIEKPSNQEIERWPFDFVKGCKPLPIQPAVFPNRYNNVLSITTMTEIHLFNVIAKNASDVAASINEELSSKIPENSVIKTLDLNNVDFALETNALNRCFDDIESVINRIQQNSVELQSFTTRWNEFAVANAGKKSKQKEAEKRRAAELAAITANRVRSEELMDTLQKLKLALIIVGRIRPLLQPPAVTATQYVNMLLSPLIAVVATTNQPPLSVAPFDFVKAVDAPLFRKGILSFIRNTITPVQLDFWKQLGDAWNISLEDWQYEVRPYRPVFRPDNYSPYLPFLDPAVIAVSLADTTDEPVERPPPLDHNVVYGLNSGPKPPQAENVVQAEVEPTSEYSGRLNSFSTDSHQPDEIQELDDVIAAADVAESVTGRTRPFTDAEYVDIIIAQNGRAVRAKTSYQAVNLSELSVDSGEVVEVLNVSGSYFTIRNVFGENGKAPAECFADIPSTMTTTTAAIGNENNLPRKASSAADTSTSSKQSTRTTSISSSSHRSEAKNVIYPVKTESRSTTSQSASSEHFEQSEKPASSSHSSSVPPQQVPAPPSTSSSPSSDQKNAAKLEQIPDSSSDTESSIISSNPNAATGPTFEEQIFSSLNQRPAAPTAVAVQPRTISDNESESEDEVIDPVPMKPKMTGVVGKNAPIPAKDYNAPPAWLKPAKQQRFASGIKTAGGRVVRVIRERDAKRSEELTMYQEEILELLETPTGSFWRVRNAGGRVGYVPLAYLQEMEFYEPKPPKKPESESSKSSKPPALLKQMAVEEPEPVISVLATKSERSLSGSNPADFTDEYSYSRLPNWSQSQPELVIVEQQSDSYRDYLLSRRRGSQGSGDKAPAFGAPLLAPFSSKTGNSARFEEARQKAASVLSLMISSQVTRLSSMDPSSAAGEQPAAASPADADTVTATYVTLSENDTKEVNTESATPDIVGDMVDIRSVTVVSKDVVSERTAGVFIKQQQKQHQMPRSSRYNDLQNIQENMSRVTHQLNSLAANGQLGLAKPLEKSKKKPQHRLRPGISAEEVRNYLIQSRFPPPIVHEFGRLNGEQLLTREKIEDFYLPDVDLVDQKRLFNLVQGARILAGMNNSDRAGIQELQRVKKVLQSNSTQ